MDKLSQIKLRNFVVVTRRCFSDERDSGSESSDFIEEGTGESSTEESSSDYISDSDIDLENSGCGIYTELAINPVDQAPPAKCKKQLPQIEHQHKRGSFRRV